MDSVKVFSYDVNDTITASRDNLLQIYIYITYYTLHTDRIITTLLYCLVHLFTQIHYIVFSGDYSKGHTRLHHPLAICDSYYMYIFYQKRLLDKLRPIKVCYGVMVCL